MNTTERLASHSLVSVSSPEFVSFLAGAEKIAVDYCAKNFPNSEAYRSIKLEATEGGRYIKVARVEIAKIDSESAKAGDRLTGSAHLFIDRVTGDVLKAASWKTPAKGARGNIFDANNGLARVGPYGTEYNR